MDLLKGGDAKWAKRKAEAKNVERKSPLIGAFFVTDNLL